MTKFYQKKKFGDFAKFTCYPAQCLCNSIIFYAFCLVGRKDFSWDSRELETVIFLADVLFQISKYNLKAFQYDTFFKSNLNF